MMRKSDGEDAQRGGGILPARGETNMPLSDAGTLPDSRASFNTQGFSEPTRSNFAFFDLSTSYTMASL